MPLRAPPASPHPSPPHLPHPFSPRSAPPRPFHEPRLPLAQFSVQGGLFVLRVISQYISQWNISIRKSPERYTRALRAAWRRGARVSRCVATGDETRRTHARMHVLRTVPMDASAGGRAGEPAAVVQEGGETQRAVSAHTATCAAHARQTTGRHQRAPPPALKIALAP